MKMRMGKGKCNAQKGYPSQTTVHASLQAKTGSCSAMIVLACVFALSLALPEKKRS